MPSIFKKLKNIIHHKKKALMHPIRSMDYLVSKENKFVIFTWARCGSTNLCYILRECFSHKLFQQRITCWGEPFNESLYGPRHIKDIHEFRNILKDIFHRYTGIKHLVGELPFQYEKYLLFKGNWKIIFLWRKNCLQRQISCELVSQTQRAHISSPSKVSSLAKMALKPLDISYMGKKIILYKRSLNLYKSYLVKSGKHFFDISYEDIYGENLTPQEKIASINRILYFLGYEQANDDKQLSKIYKKWLDPEKQKMSRAKEYRLIPTY